jgi:hypothetical protein
MRGVGGSMNGNSAISPSSSAHAQDDGRQRHAENLRVGKFVALQKSASSYRRMHTPLITARNARRWLAAAREIFSICNCSTFWRML